MVMLCEIKANESRYQGHGKIRILFSAKKTMFSQTVSLLLFVLKDCKRFSNCFIKAVSHASSLKESSEY